MFPHWSTVIHPCLRALNSGPIIEIGAFSGETTEALAPLAAEGGFLLHVVDPLPQFDTKAFEARFPDSFRLHRQRSHDVLGQIDAATAVLIDGDHNWYTVHGELKQLEEVAIAAGHHFPLTFFHDVEWPYARRDMYWDPEAIPEQYRRPCSRDGIRWGQRHLDEMGGISRGNLQAIEEGGPRNGVLTAVEDFIKESTLPLELRIVRGSHGLGILAPLDLLAANPELREQWAKLHSTEFLLEQAGQLASVVLMENAALKEALSKSERLEGELEEARGESESRGESAVPPSQIQGTSVPSMQACNICGEREFVPGPNGRLSSSGMPPQCGGCRSLERQRALRDCLLRVPAEMLSWRRAIQFAPDASLDPAWFKSFETSVYEGENSIDLQEIERPPDSYDFISLSSVLEFVPDDRRAFAELARIGSDRCIIHSTFLSSLDSPTSTHFEEPHGTFGRYHDYGADLEKWFETDRFGMSTVVVAGVDPVTMDATPMHFFCRDDRDAKVLLDSFTTSQTREAADI